MDHIQITAQAVAEAITIERKRSADEIARLRTQVVKAFADAKGRAGVVLSEENDRLIDEIEQLRKSLADLTDQACEMEAEIERLCSGREVIDQIIGNWRNPQYLKLHAGDLTEQELRTVRAVLEAVRLQISQSLL